MSPECGEGVVRYDGPLTVFETTYKADSVLHSFRSSMPSGRDLGGVLADGWFTGASLLPTILVASGVLSLAIGFFVWKALRQCGPEAWQSRLRGKFEWSLQQHRLVLALGFVLFLMGFSASIMVLAQTTETTRLHVTLTEVHESSQTLLKAIQTDVDTAIASLVDIQAQAREGVLWLEASRARLELSAQRQTPALAGNDKAAVDDAVVVEQAAAKKMHDTIADVEPQAASVLDAVADTRDALDGELNSTTFSDMRDGAKPYWDTAVLLSHLTWGFIGGSLSGIVAKLLYDYSRLYRVKVEYKPADSVAESKDAAVLLKVFDAGTRVLTWLSLSLLVVLAIVFALAASYTSVICTEPYAVASAYLDVTGATDVSSYYLECTTDVATYHCANPMAEDIATIDERLLDLAVVVDRLRVAYTEYEAAYLVVADLLSPKPAFVPSPQVVAIEENEQTFREDIRIAVYGAADCGTVGPLFDQEISRVCNDQGRWVITTAICSLIVVCAFFLLAILAALMADAVKYRLSRKRDVESATAGRLSPHFSARIYNGARQAYQAQGRQKAIPAQDSQPRRHQRRHRRRR